MVGVNVNEDTRTNGFGFANGAQSFSVVSSPRRGVIGGPSLDLQLPASFYLEVDAVYRPVRTTTVTTNNGIVLPTRSDSLGNWDLPLLAKRRFVTPFGIPILEAGPAFRVGAGDLSHYGVAAGLGVELHIGAVRIVPTFRYSHWALDGLSSSAASVRNRLDFLVAFHPRSGG